jgi:hypothetical protein
MDVFDDEGREMLRNFEHTMLLSPQERGAVVESEPPIRPYMDEVLRSDPAEYKDFVAELWNRGLYEFDFDFVDEVVPFLVDKTGVALRLIMDARCPNRRFRVPPKMRMASGSALGGVRLPPLNHSRA